jgi:hypothetical protein
LRSLEVICNTTVDVCPTNFQMSICKISYKLILICKISYKLMILTPPLEISGRKQNLDHSTVYICYNENGFDQLVSVFNKYFLSPHIKNKTKSSTIHH